MFQDIVRKIRSSAHLVTEDLGPDYPEIRAHVLDRIRTAKVGEKPFYHSFIDRIFPDDFYAALHAHMLEFKGSEKMQARKQDNAKFVNRRYNLVDSEKLIVRQLLNPRCYFIRFSAR